MRWSNIELELEGHERDGGARVSWRGTRELEGHARVRGARASRRRARELRGTREGADARGQMHIMRGVKRKNASHDMKKTNNFRTTFVYKVYF